MSRAALRGTPMAARDGWDYEPAAPRPDLADAVQGGDEPEAAALVLADWLDEQGDAIRARFVRLSAWVRLDPWGDDALAWERERAWLWAVCAPQWRPKPPERLWWARSAPSEEAPLGLPMAIEGELGPLSRHADAIFDRTGARDICLTGDDAARLRLRRPRWLARVAGVRVNFFVWPDRRARAFERLAACLPDVRRLEIAGPERERVAVPPGFVAAFGRLRELDLEDVVSIEAFAGAPFLQNLTRLWLSSVEWSDGLSPDSVPSLRRLAFAEDSAHGRALGRACEIGSLEELEVNDIWERLSPSELALRGWCTLPGLRSLLLSWGDWADPDPAALVSILRACDGLRRLDIRASRQPPVCHALAEWPGLAALRSLDLGFGWADAATIAALTRSPHAGGLRSLTFTSAVGPAEALRLVADGFSPGQLRELAFLSAGDLAPDHWTDLAAPSSALRELRSLAVFRCPTPPDVAAGWAERLPLEELTFALPEGHTLGRPWAERVGRSPTLRLLRVERHDFGADPASVPRGWLARGDMCVRRPR